jgi:regulator of sirC expression with transglutaminase-like and TPR domain
MTPVIAANEVAHLMRSAIQQDIESDEGFLAAVAAAGSFSKPMTAVELEGKIKDWTHAIRSRVKGDQPQALLAHFHEHFFDELKFGTPPRADVGFRIEHYDIRNVVDKKVTVPTVAAALYAMVARGLNFKAEGLALPGHFLVKLTYTESDREVTLLVDPYNGGRTLDDDDLSEIIHAIDPEYAANTDLEAMKVGIPHQVWVTRILQGMLRVAGMKTAGFVIEMETLLWPDRLELQRDLALIYARIGKTGPAKTLLLDYLSTESGTNDPQVKSLQQLVASLEPEPDKAA